ncbi:MAG: hypothetical protein F6K00_29100 [Leptolyngbya sp. SIOISBB]|nr:hypothetical protein [Leptolyngbya sp. SIOISBB]
MSSFDISDRDYDFKLGEYIGRGWEIFKANALPFIGFTLITFVGLGIISALLPPPLGSGNLEDGGGLGIVSSILLNLLIPGIYLVAFQIARNRPTAFGDFFQGFNRALPILVLAILSGLLITVASICFLLPGIYLAVSYMFALPLLLDKNLDFWPAMETSRKLITKKWFSFFGFALVLGLINFGGLLLIGLGFLVTFPLTICATVAAYEDIVGLNSVADSSPIE